MSADDSSSSSGGGGGGGGGGKKEKDAEVSQLKDKLTNLSSSTSHEKRSVAKLFAGRSKTIRMSKNVDMVDLLSQQVQEAYDELARREDELRMAAEMGQQVVGKLEDTMDRVTELEDVNYQLEQSLNKERTGRLEAERLVRKLKLQISDHQTFEAEHTAQVEKLEKQLEQAQKVIEEQSSATVSVESTAGNAIRDLKSQVAKLEAELRSKEESNMQLNRQLRDSRRQVAENVDDLERVQTELHDLRQMKNEYSNMAGLREEVEKLRQENQSLSEDSVMLYTQYRELGQKYNRLFKEHEESTDLLRNAEESRQEMQQKFEQIRLSGLAEGHDISAFLNNSVNMSDSQSPVKSGPSTPAGVVPMSMGDRLDMLEEEDDDSEDESGSEDEADSGDEQGRDEVKQVDPSADMEQLQKGLNIDYEEKRRAQERRELERQNTGDHPLQGGADGGKDEEDSNQSGRRGAQDGEKEFFHLTCMAVKINTQKFMNHISTVNHKTLYEKAKYHSWVEKEITAAYLEEVYKKKKAQRAAVAPRAAVPGQYASPVRPKATSLFQRVSNFFSPNKGSSAGGGSPAGHATRQKRAGTTARPPPPAGPPPQAGGGSSLRQKRAMSMAAHRPDLPH